MFDKMKQVMEMQRKMQDMKRELEQTDFEIASGDGLIKIVMNGAQEVKEVMLADDVKSAEKTHLEKILKDTYNRAIKRSHDIAAEKMKSMTGFDIPGLT